MYVCMNLHTHHTTAAWERIEECGPICYGDLLTASLVYIAWQVLYYIKIEVLDKGMYVRMYVGR